MQSTAVRKKVDQYLEKTFGKKTFINNPRLSLYLDGFSKWNGVEMYGFRGLKILILQDKKDENIIHWKIASK